MILGQFLGEETREVEYKEFKLQLCHNSNVNYKELFYDHKKLIDMFQRIMNSNIEKYIPKYACSFFNSSITGLLRFGISDMGEVIGVPILRYNTEVYFRYLKYLIKHHISTKCCYNIDLEEILENIDLKFHRINTEDSTFNTYPNSEEYIDQKIRENYHYNIIRDRYIKEKRYFIYMIERYRRPINVIINELDIRDDFRKYLMYHGVFRKYEKELNDKNTIVFPERSIKVLKHDSENLVHWITRYRDDKSDEIIRELRPKWNYKVRPVDPYYNILQDFKPMVDVLLKRGFDMYVIEISFDFSDRNSYLEDIGHLCDNEVRYPKRTIDDLGVPCCVF